MDLDSILKHKRLLIEEIKNHNAYLIEPKHRTAGVSLPKGSVREP